MKLTGPSISTAASGSLADILTYSRGKKTAYAKQHAAPTNPKSGPQTSIRAMVAFLSRNWRTLSTADVETWRPLANDLHVAPYHAFIAENMKRWKTFRFPSKAYPATETTVIPAVIYQQAFDGKAHIKIWRASGAGILPWGYLTYRSPLPFAAGVWDQCVNVMLRDPAATTKWNDTPLPPGHYYYRTSSFTDTGFVSTAGNRDDAWST